MTVVWVCELTAVLEKPETLFWLINRLFFALGSLSYGAPEIRRPKATKWLKSNYINEVKRCHHIIQKWETFLQLSLGWSDWSVQNRYFGSSQRNTIKEMDGHLLVRQNYDEEPAGRDMPFVLRQHVQHRQQQVSARMWRNQNPHTPPVGYKLVKEDGGRSSMLIIELLYNKVTRLLIISTNKWKNMFTQGFVCDCSE